MNTLTKFASFVLSAHSSPASMNLCAAEKPSSFRRGQSRRPNRSCSVSRNGNRNANSIRSRFPADSFRSSLCGGRHLAPGWTENSSDGTQSSISGSLCGNGGRALSLSSENSLAGPRQSRRYPGKMRNAGNP